MQGDKIFDAGGPTVAASSSTRLLTLPEVSELTRVPDGTLRAWRKLGTGPASSRLGRRVVYRESDVQTWIADQLAGGPTSGTAA